MPQVKHQNLLFFFPLNGVDYLLPPVKLRPKCLIHAHGCLETFLGVYLHCEELYVLKYFEELRKPE